MIEAMQHSCTLTRAAVDRRLNFDAGSAAFTVGKVLTGATSHATGTVKSVTLSTGSWALGTAAGYLVLSNTTGIFVDNEPIADNGTTPGAALANGADIDNTDDFGVKSSTMTVTTLRCRFINPKGGMRKLDSGEHVFNLPSVILPEGTVVSEGDTITGITTGFTRAHRVKYARPIQADEGISHVRCDIEAVT